MTGHDLLLIANSIICGGIALRVMFLPAQRIAPPPLGWVDSLFPHRGGGQYPAAHRVLIPVPLSC